MAGNALNWDGAFLRETEERHDEVNSIMDVLLNFGGFMYIGAIMPWSEFHRPEITSITIGRLMGLGFLVLILPRIPAVFAIYKLMPGVVVDWKEALFMGYFGPTGAGAVFYVEHTRHLFPELGEGDEEETNLVRAMIPCVYFLVIFSIVVHGLSIPALDLFYKWRKVEPIQEDAIEIRRKSLTVATRSRYIHRLQPLLAPRLQCRRPSHDCVQEGLPRRGDEVQAVRVQGEDHGCGAGVA